jgi:hypothetical protein
VFIARSLKIVPVPLQYLYPIPTLHFLTSLQYHYTHLGRIIQEECENLFYLFFMHNGDVLFCVILVGLGKDVRSACFSVEPRGVSNANTLASRANILIGCAQQMVSVIPKLTAIQHKKERPLCVVRAAARMLCDRWSELMRIGSLGKTMVYSKKKKGSQ